MTTAAVEVTGKAAAGRGEPRLATARPASLYVRSTRN